MLETRYTITITKSDNYYQTKTLLIPIPMS